MKIDTRPSQWVGVALIVGWMALLGVVVPRVGAAIPREAEVAAGTAIAAGGIAITPAAGWGLPKDAPEGILILRKGGAQITGLPPQPAASEDPTVPLKTATDALAIDPSTSWKIGDPTSFETTSGAKGAYAVALAPTQFITNLVIVKDGQSVQIVVSGTDTDWTTLHDEIVEMAKTIEIKEGGA
jgi:hypothetical protein